MKLVVFQCSESEKTEKDCKKIENKIETSKSENTEDEFVEIKTKENIKTIPNIDTKYYYKPKRELKQRKQLSQRKQEQLRNARKKAQETYRRRREEKARLQEEERIRKYVKIIKPEIIKEKEQPIKNKTINDDYMIEDLLKQMEEENY